MALLPQNSTDLGLEADKLLDREAAVSMESQQGGDNGSQNGLMRRRWGDGCSSNLNGTITAEAVNGFSVIETLKAEEPKAFLCWNDSNSPVAAFLKTMKGDSAAGCKPPTL